MERKTNSRRCFVKNSAATIGLLSLQGLLYGQNEKPFAGKKIVCVGGHPDDPESTCGGTLSKLTAAGHSVTVIYLTTGEAGITGKTHAEAAATRKQEAINACKILDCKPLFAGQVDGDSIVNNEWINTITTMIADEKPDIVFVHWPIDSHKDHQAASLLTIQAWMRSKEKFMLYFTEACIGGQTMTFHPTDYIDISDTQEQKRKAIYCHTSQDPASIYTCGHAAMEEFRGREIGVKAAEAFVRMNGRMQGGLIL
jgi:LmbE family N-acetylglucosaminyl deacetylase